MLKKVFAVGEWLSKQLGVALSLDLRSLALARISVGIIILLDLGFRLPDLTAHYSDVGILPRPQLFSHFSNLWSLHAASGAEWFQFLMFIVAAILAVMLIIGWQTRIATIGSWIMWVSLINRGPLLDNAGDSALTLLLFWAIFLPWGRVFSVDAKQKPDSYEHLSVASFAWIVQLALIYWVSVAFKTGTQWTVDYTASYLALNLDQFVTRLGLILRQSLGLMKLLTFMVVKFEIIGPVMFFLPFINGAFKTIAVFGFIALHLGFALFMELGIFPFIMIAFNLGILGPFFWDELLPDLIRLFPEKIVDKLRASLRSTRSQVRSSLGRIITLNTQPIASIKIPKVISGLGSLALEVFVGFLLTLVVTWNLTTLPTSSSKFPQQFQQMMITLKLSQKWNMFSPYPLTEDGWFLVTAVGKDGNLYDLQHPGQIANFDKPELVSADYPNQRWRKYMTTLASSGYDSHREYFLRYKCIGWKQDPNYAPGNINLVFILEKTLPTRIAPPQNQNLASTHC